MTRFESLVEDWPLGNAIVSERAETFDRVHGLFFAPIQYVPYPIEGDVSQPPTMEWIGEHFLSLVRDEFRDAQGPVPLSRTPQLMPTEQAGSDLLEMGRKLRDDAEQGLIYNPRFFEIFSRYFPQDFENRLRSVLDHSDIGNRKNREFLDDGYLRFLFSRMKTGVRLVFPGLPFRDQNPLRTDGAADHMTLAEIYYLIRLHCTALAIYQVLPTGADILILSDGSFFGETLGVPGEQISKYFNSVRYFRDQLNLSGTIQIVELRKVVDIWDNGRGVVYETVGEIEKSLRTVIDNSGKYADAWRSLSIGVRRNFNTRRFGVASSDLAGWIVGNPSVESSLPASAAIEALSARYAALNLALKWHEVISQVLPTAMRATVHPKPGQIGLPKLGSCLPWNGVAITNGSEIAWNNIEVHALSEAARRGFSLTPVAKGDNVLYYRRDRN